MLNYDIGIALGETSIRFKLGETSMHLELGETSIHIELGETSIHLAGVGDPDLQDPHVFWSPGSRSISQRYGSVSGTRSESFPFFSKGKVMLAKIKFYYKILAKN